MRGSKKKSVTTDETQSSKVTQRYWWLLGQGLCALLFGILAIFWSKLTLFLFLYIFGIYAIIDGLAPLGQAIFGGERAQRRGRQILILEGIISIVCGVLTLLLPRAHNRLLFYIVAAWLLLKGISFVMQARARGWLTGLLGVLAIGAGLYILLNPTAGPHNILLLVGIFALVMGVLLLVRGWRARSRQRAELSPTG
jgi:uncharacterized membrane protein HdeD (DUF308 family)